MKRFLKLLLPLLLLSILFACKPSEYDTFGSIYGVVRDMDTAKRVQNATVVLSPGGTSLMTDNMGRFEYQSLEPQQYTITVQKTGYSTNRKSVTVLAGEKTEANISICKKPEDGTGDDETDGDGETDEYCVLTAIGLMVQKEDLGKGNWATANALCAGSILAGYTDWRLPTKEELMVLYTSRNSIGGFSEDGYWSSDRYGSYYSYVDFKDGSLKIGSSWDDDKHRVRAVRSIK